MFFRFRKAGRSELLKEEAHDATSVPEKERERADSVDASTTVVGSAAVNGDVECRQQRVEQRVQSQDAFSVVDGTECCPASLGQPGQLNVWNILNAMGIGMDLRLRVATFSQLFERINLQLPYLIRVVDRTPIPGIADVDDVNVNLVNHKTQRRQRPRQMATDRTGANKQ